MDTQKALAILPEVREAQLDAKLVDIFIDRELYGNRSETALKRAANSHSAFDLNHTHPILQKATRNQ